MRSLVARKSVPEIILWALMLVGAAFAGWRFVFGLGSIANINNAYPWGFWTGAFMTMIACGGAGFTVALVAEVLGLHRYAPLVRPSVLVGLLFYLSYMVVLLIELGRPWMGWLVFFSWQPTSPLFEIALCASAYTTCLFIEFGKIVARDRAWDRVLGILKWVYFPAVVLGVSLSHIHQSTLGTTLNIVPLKIDARWWSELLPAFFLITAYMAGFAVITIEHVLATHFLRRKPRVDLLAGLAKFQVVLLTLYLVLRIGDALARGLVPSLFEFSGSSISIWVELLFGSLIPLVMLLLPEVRGSKWALLGASSLIVGGVFLNRLNVTVLSMKVKHWESYIPAVGEIMTSVGTVAGAILVYMLVVKHFPIHTEPALEPDEREVEEARR